ncbi:ribonuclease III [Rhabdothermincola sp.]|uniref:ribonuclease III n=1 Tax=Rhabdothermincola sp. TaxID=2820405 RepID=UPI002FE030C5
MPSTTWWPSSAESGGRHTLASLDDRLGYSFTDHALEQLALTHRSWCSENPGHESNERLEFLGDAVLGLVVTEYVFVRYPAMPEGQLAKTRASVVNATTLAEVAAEVGLGPALRLGKGEEASGGRSKSSLLADAMEAVIGAVYLDGGYDAARRLVLSLLTDRIEVAAEGPGEHDYKTQLQELAARRFDELPVYRIRDEGPDHDKRFFAAVHLGGEVAGEGEGRSKKQAEQAAAKDAWARITSGLSDRGGEGERA